MQCAHSKHIKHSHMTRLRKFQRREQNQTAVLLLWMPLQYFLAKAGSWCLASMFKDKWVFPKIGGYPPKSSILIGFSIINHPFWGTPIFGNTQIKNCMQLFFFKTWLSKPYGFFTQKIHRTQTFAGGERPPGMSTVVGKSWAAWLTYCVVIIW